MREIREGLFVRGKLDLDHSQVAVQAWRAMKDDTVSLSFGYLATDQKRGRDGVNQLREIDLYEVSLTATPANPDTRVLAMKSTDPARTPTSQNRGCPSAGRTGSPDSETTRQAQSGVSIPRRSSSAISAAAPTACGSTPPWASTSS
jgi:Caudovirus prohead serine protease